MSHAEFFASLFRSATGWLGWPPAVALATAIPHIELAMEGRAEMLKAIFGGGDKSGGGGSVGQKAKLAFGSLGARRVERKKP